MSFWWLGQAGFAYLYKKTRILIDPYLSDSLARKYQGKIFPHSRMMPVPVNPRDFQGVEWLLITHRHTDHMDPETIVPLAEVNPGMKIVLPAAYVKLALQYGLLSEQLVPVNAGDKVMLSENMEVHVIPSAHEILEKDEDGNFLYLGYIMKYRSTDFREKDKGETVLINEFTLYHSGDCLPYPGLVDLLKNHGVDAAFLPVNGRDAYRKSNGVPGNFTFREAVQVCREARIPFMIPHHFGMFDFNTIDKDTLRKEISEISSDITCIEPQVGIRYGFTT